MAKLTNTKRIDLEWLAEALGYEVVRWDAENECYSGYGSSDSSDRSRDDAGGLFVASDVAELEHVARMAS